MEEYPCDLCGSRDAVEVPECRKYTHNQPIHICKSCGFVYVKNRRSAQEVADAWSNEIYESRYTARIPVVKARHTYVAEFIDVSLSIKGKSVIDIGAGEGDFMKMLRDQYGARSVFGIEPSKRNCELMTEVGISSFAGTIESFIESSLTESKQQYDLVTILWTLENCRSCTDMLQAAYNLCIDDGFVAIGTGSRILVPFKKRLNDYIGISPGSADTHAFRFSANTLRGLLAKAGFEVLHTNRYIDTDWLVMLAKKQPKGKSISWEKDDWRKVSDFFSRWDKETQYYN